MTLDHEFVEPPPPSFLLVEDDPNDSLLLRRALGGRRRRIVINTVTDGRAAIDYLAQACNGSAHVRRPFLVLTDVNLPVKSGWDVLAWVRSQPAIQNLPVMVWTSLPNPEGSNRARELGAARYFGKPRDLAGYFDVADLVCAYLGD